MSLYILSMIRSFACRDTENIFHRQRSKKFLLDLRVPPANRLEKLRGDRLGQYSIRINDQWRVCFVWEDGDVLDVEIVDYH